MIILCRAGADCANREVWCEIGGSQQFILHIYERRGRISLDNPPHLWYHTCIYYGYNYALRRSGALFGLCRSVVFLRKNAFLRQDFCGGSARRIFCRVCPDACKNGNTVYVRIVSADAVCACLFCCAPRTVSVRIACRETRHCIVQASA